MGRKVFMSVLGTGPYKECLYKGKNCSTQTRFIQEATLKDIGAETWSEKDAVCIVMTAKARELNWQKGATGRTNPDGMVIPGLEAHLENMHLHCGIDTLDIPDGKDEAEIWKIFDIIYNFLEEGDELYFDLTHAFRYQPMLLLVLGNYAKFLKNVKIAYMGYGNYEGREINADGHPESDVAPIMDLLPISILQDWTFAAGQFIRSGNADEICELGSGKCIELKRKINGRDEGIDNLNAFVRLLKTLSDNLMLCRGPQIISGDDISKMRKYESALNEEAIPAFAPLLTKITDSFSEFQGNRCVMNSYYAARWCLEKNLYQQALTFLREFVVSFFCEKYGLDITGEKTSRTVVESIFSANNPKNNETILIKAEHIPMFNKLSEDSLFKDKDFVMAVGNLRGLRNDVNHSGMRKDSADAKKIIKNINSFVEKFCGYLSVNDLSGEKNLPAIFINYTNHPSATWGEQQLAAAKEYGEVVDLPFRSVEEDIDEKRLAEIAEEETGKILELSAGKNATVHIMGEMTLTFAIVAKLKATGVPCVASTTARQVIENADGTRTSAFNFVRFRAY